MKTPRSRRSSVELVGSIGIPFRELTAIRGHHGSTLAYAALAEAVRNARAGHLEAVPSTAWAPRGSGEPTLTVEFPQRAEEAAAWSRELRAAGSSPRAVITAFAWAYNQAGGDLIAMERPTREPPADRSLAAVVRAA